MGIIVFAHTKCEQTTCDEKCIQADCDANAAAAAAAQATADAVHDSKCDQVTCSLLVWNITDLSNKYDELEERYKQLEAKLATSLPLTQVSCQACSDLGQGYSCCKAEQNYLCPPGYSAESIQDCNFGCGTDVCCSTTCVFQQPLNCSNWCYEEGGICWDGSGCVDVIAPPAECSNQDGCSSPHYCCLSETACPTCSTQEGNCCDTTQGYQCLSNYVIGNPGGCPNAPCANQGEVCCSEPCI